jgi:hypothetical protein
VIPTDAALVLFLLALGLCLGAGAHVSALTGPTRLTIALDTAALICGLLVLIFISPVVFIR